MKFNQKVNIVDAIKFEYHKNGYDELRKFLPSAMVEVFIAKCPGSVWEFSIVTYKGFSPVTNPPLIGKEGDWIVKNIHGEIKVLEENDFLDQYESVL